MCGIGKFSIGDRWQIWLNKNGETHMCTRTTPFIDQDRLELQKLANHFLDGK